MIESDFPKTKMARLFPDREKVELYNTVSSIK